MKSVSNIEIGLDSVKEGLRLWIDARIPDSLFDAEENAAENNEARYQMVEGCYYDYQISDGDFYWEITNIELFSSIKETQI